MNNYKILIYCFLITIFLKKNLTRKVFYNCIKIFYNYWYTEIFLSSKYENIFAIFTQNVNIYVQLKQ